VNFKLNKLKWIIATCALAVWAYVAMKPSLISSKTRLIPNESEQGLSAAESNQINEWSLNAEYGIPVWVARNATSGTLARKMYLFIDVKDFAEENLKRVFSGFAQKYDQPYNLIIHAFADKAVIEELLREEESTAVNTRNGKSVGSGSFRAAYYRMDGEESITYGPAPDRKDPVTIMLKEKVIPYGGNIEQDLLLAAEEGDIDQARNLLARGANANAVNREGDNALMLAVLNVRTQIVRELLRKTRDIDHRNNEGWTALMYAAVEGETGIVKRLLEIGAEVNAKNENGYTPLMLAASRGQEDVVKILLSKRAYLNSKNNDGRTTLSLVESALSGDVRDRIVSLLKKAGAKK